MKEFAAAINQSLASKSSMKIGATIKHPDDYLVYVVNGTYLDPVYGRISNWWEWKRLLPNGKPAAKTESGYGW